MAYTRVTLKTGDILGVTREEIPVYEPIMGTDMVDTYIPADYTSGLPEFTLNGKPITKAEATALLDAERE